MTYAWDGSEDWSDKVIDGDLVIANYVTSLKGCPKEVTGYFQCDTPNVTSLKYMPQKIGRDIYLSYSGIKNFEGMPKNYRGRVYAKNCENLTSLKGLPKRLHSLNVSECPNLKSLNGDLEYIEEELNCGNSGIVEINSNIKNIGDLFDCSDCKNLVSLKGSPEKVKNIKFNNCVNLKSLKGISQIIKGDIYLTKTGIENLEGMPEKIDGTIICNECENLKSLKGIPKKIRYGMFLSNQSLEIIDDLPQQFNSIDFNYSPIRKITLNAISKIGTDFWKLENIDENVVSRMRILGFTILNYPKIKEKNEEIFKKIDKIFFNN